MVYDCIAIEEDDVYCLVYMDIETMKLYGFVIDINTGEIIEELNEFRFMENVK